MILMKSKREEKTREKRGKEKELERCSKSRRRTNAVFQRYFRSGRSSMSDRPLSALSLPHSQSFSLSLIQFLFIILSVRNLKYTYFTKE